MPDPKKPNPGPPLSLTDEELELLTEVTPEDIEEARKLWRRVVPAEFRDLLDAQLAIEDEE